MRKHFFIILLCLLASSTRLYAEKDPDQSFLWYYKTSQWIDNYLFHGLDTNYINFPEHSFKVAFTSGIVGLNSTIQSETGAVDYPYIQLINDSRPSLDLGFQVGFRSFGFGYSWDALHAYSQKLNFSFGSKSIGLDFSLNRSSNINTAIALGNDKAGIPGDLVKISNARLTVWYALNSAHYSHNAAVKQGFIQRKTAGSLLLNLKYMSSNVELLDTLRLSNDLPPILSLLMRDMTAIQTRQISVGIGYGINYTPNNGKVVLHLSANALLVCYSVNTISYFTPDSIAENLPGEPMYTIKPSFPVHVTGNVRAAVSWEINKWVHLNVYAYGGNIRFKSAENSYMLSNWEWQARATIGVRFGASRDKAHRALAKYNSLKEPILYDRLEGRKLPTWLTDYFWAPK